MWHTIVDIHTNSPSPPMRPPLGLMPREVADKIRMIDIVDAMKRYVDDGKEIPVEWIEELLEIRRKYED